jgi:hypothetical protein
VPHIPQEVGVPVQPGAGSGLLLPAVVEAKVENFFANLVEPQWGHFVPSQWPERTRISLSRSHFPQ